VLTLTDAGYQFPRVAGTSAGAITAALIVSLRTARQPLTKLRDYVDSIDYTKFEDTSRLQRELGAVGEAERLLFHDGLYSGAYLVEWLGGILEDLGVTTFGQLRVDDPGSSLPEACRYSLVVLASDITRGKLVRLPWDYPDYGEQADDQRIVDAVRASMSIPFFFRPVRLTVPAATFDGVDYPPGKVTWVDGGMLSNFAVEAFDRSDGEPSRWPTIGIKLSARQVVMPKKKETRGVASETIACLRTLVDNADRTYLTPDKVARTIFVDTDAISATDFHLSVEQRDTLYANGCAAATQWLAARR
jgi:NTE family protein